ncbi:MAG: hypothetical protein AAB372_01750 [Patescibacteria group bacterium]
MEIGRLQLVGIVGVFIIALGVLGGFFTGNVHQVGVETPNVSLTRPQDTNKPKNQQILNAFGESGGGFGGQTIVPVPFENIVDPFSSITKPIVNPIKNPQNLPAQKVLSEREIFDDLFPSFYLASLNHIQGQLIEIGWIDSQKRKALDTEPRVLEFLGATQEILIDHGAYPDEKARAAARYAVTKGYPRLLEQRKALLRRPQASIFDVFDLSHPVIADYEEQLGRVISLVFTAVPEAHAQINVPGIWETFDTCFKGINPAQGNVGKDFYSFCCNCGIKFYGYIPVFMTDCGPFAGKDAQSELCDIHLGCLNKTCEGWNNAIWDGIFPPTIGNVSEYTNKCACDDPQKTNENQGTDDSGNSNSSEGSGGSTGENGSTQMN